LEWDILKKIVLPYIIEYVEGFNSFKDPMKAQIIHQRFFFIITFTILLLFPSLLFPFKNAKGSDQYVIRFLTTENGLPQNTIYDISQDKGGYMWIGTDGGLVCYDGIAFDHYNKLNTKNINNNSITALFSAKNGTMWIGTYGGGVTLYKDKTFVSYSTQNHLSNDFIWRIIEDSNNNIWLGTVGGGIIRYKNNQFTTFSQTQGLSNNIINSIYEDRKGYIWIGTENGLNQLNGEVFKIFTTEHGLSDNNIMSIYEDSKGILWIGTMNGLTAKRGNRILNYTTKNGLLDNIVRAIYEDKIGNLWIATNGGLNHISFLNRTFSQDIQIEPFDYGNGTFSNPLINIFEDREGNLWVGTSGQGIILLQYKKLISYSMEDGLVRNNIRAIFQDEQEAMWIGTNGGGISLWKDGEVKTFSTQDGLADNFINSICSDGKKNLWVGTRRGLSKFNNGTFYTYTQKDGLSTDSIQVLHQDHLDQLWIGTYGGGLNCFNIKKKKFMIYNQRSGLSNDFVLCINDDEKGNLWVGTNKGLNCFKDEKFKNYFRKDGLSNDMIYDIYRDNDGTLWIGTNGGGLNRFKDGTFTSYTTESGLFSNVIYKIIEDNKKCLWMSSNEGIFTVSKRELNQMIRGKRFHLNCKFFGEEDGMRSSVCTGGFQPAGGKRKDGFLWFPTINGIIVLDPVTITYNTVKPPIYIKQIIVDGRSKKVGEPLKLPANTREVKFSFTALSYSAPRKVKFRYRLRDIDDKWVETSSREQVVYSDLASGEYRFEVTACNNNGIWNETASTAEFTIKPKFQETFWFYLIVASSLTMGGLLAFKFKERRHKQRAEKNKKYQASTLSESKSFYYSQRLLKLMVEDKPYLDPNVTAVDLAEALDISSKHLSQIINQQFNKNFKNFINEYRVEEAKKRLLDPKEQHFVLLKIAMDVGFNSKSVFNAAFKKFTNMSPSEYRKKNLK
jgi:ligand-binding sensor domain-containing protein/AraC-like DNA-binding protein